jgi:hypothetical protein
MSKDVNIKIDADLADEIQRLSKEAGASDRNLLAALVWMAKKAFGRDVKISGKGESQVLNIKTFSDLQRMEPVESLQPAAISADEEEDEEEFPEDFEEYYPRGFIDAPKAEGTVTIESKREDTRGRLALVYTIATFLMFLLGFVVAVVDAAIRETSIVDNLTKVLPLLSGIFLGSLGFVLGYYFRKVEGEEASPRSTNL